MLIYSDDHLEVIYQPARSDFLLITFNEMEMRANGSRFWGARFCAKAEVSTLGFVTKKPNWFPVTSMRQATAACADLINGYSERVLYGHSQGGYATLRYARLLNASISISFCPQFSIDPADVPTDNRFRAHFNPTTHKGMAIAPSDASGRAYVFFDPFHRLDLLNANLILRVRPDACQVKAFMTGHSTVRAFAGTERTLALIRACRQDNRADLLAINDAARRTAMIRPYQTAITAIRKHPSWADAIFKAHKDGLPEVQKANFYFHRAERFIRDGQLKDAHGALSEALKLHPNAPFAKRLAELESRMSRERRPVMPAGQ